MNKYRVVFHLDEPSKGRADQVFRNIENLMDDLGENNVGVELVANGGGVKALVKGPDSHAEQFRCLCPFHEPVGNRKGHTFGIGRGRLIRCRGTGQKAGGGMGIYSALT